MKTSAAARSSGDAPSPSFSSRMPERNGFGGFLTSGGRRVQVLRSSSQRKPMAFIFSACSGVTSAAQRLRIAAYGRSRAWGAERRALPPHSMTCGIATHFDDSLQLLRAMRGASNGLLCNLAALGELCLQPRRWLCGAGSRPLKIDLAPQKSEPWSTLRAPGTSACILCKATVIKAESAASVPLRPLAQLTLWSLSGLFIRQRLPDAICASRPRLLDPRILLCPIDTKDQKTSGTSTPLHLLWANSRTTMMYGDGPTTEMEDVAVFSIARGPRGPI